VGNNLLALPGAPFVVSQTVHLLQRPHAGLRNAQRPRARRFCPKAASSSINGADFLHGAEVVFSAQAICPDSRVSPPDPMITATGPCSSVPES
jgi:hypothetical protein